ncbi:MAG: DUF3090 family protein, partial [Saprospiraceae bacterium]|nr:DUF3090 family protein [Saprospiraceae bacterium]
MPRNEIDINPVIHITTDAIGKPGQRVFYIQARQSEAQAITLILEKSQIQTLALGIEQFLAEVQQKYPDLVEASAEYDEDKMAINPPVDPMFRAGELGLAYDSDLDKIVLVAREIPAEGMEPEETNLIRFWCTRSQMRALASWGLDVVNRGRQICPQCGEPM